MLHAIVFRYHFDKSALSLLIRFAAVAAPLICVQLGQHKTGDLLFLFRQHWLVKTFAYSVMTYLILVWGVMTAVEFIYFQF